MAKEAIEETQNIPPTEEEIQAAMPCKFSCCKDLHQNDEHWVNNFFIPIPKMNNMETLSKIKDLVPASVLIAQQIQNQTSGRLFQVL